VGPGELPAAAEGREVAEAAPPGARPIAEIYQIDPLVYTRCGQKMQMILVGQLSIRLVPLLV
jgi:hypothetical protein